MSTGADCHFDEIEPGRWTYWLQDWPYGEWPEGQTFGPFPSYEVAQQHLHDNHANPGGHSTLIHPTSHVHEKGEIWKGGYQGPGCPACYMTEKEITDAR